MENPVDKSNLIVRAALYLEYEGKCFYEGLPIRFQDMHVDHIIPEYLEGTDELKKIIKTLGLPENFNINSVYNLVPCNPNVNQVKNKKEYPVEFLSHCINMKTKPRADKIKERVKKLTDEYKADKKLAKLTAMLNEYDNKEKLEELYNTLSREKPFDEFSEVNKGGNFYTYAKSLSNVHLSGFIPLYPTLEGSCLITFSNLRLRDCMITLNHKQIMKSLFSGVNTDLDLKLRNYIIYPYGDKQKIYYVDLANTRIPLERKEVEQLTKIIDDFYDYYIKECRLEHPGEVVISDPHKVAIDQSNNVAISASTTIKNASGDIVGALAIDTSLNKLSEIVRNIKIGENGYVFIFLKDGTMLAHANSEFDFKNVYELEGSDGKTANDKKFSFKDINKLLNTDNDNFETIVDEKEAFVSVYTSPHTGWKMATVIPKSDLTNKVSNVEKLIFGITIS